MSPHLSSKWAADVIGEHDLLPFDDFQYAHPQGVWDGKQTDLTNDSGIIPPFYDHATFLLPILFAYEMIHDLGWAEHTSDWDWCVAIQTRDGMWHGDYLRVQPDLEDPQEDDYADTFKIALDGNILTPQEMPMDMKLDYGDITIELTNGVHIKLRYIAQVYIDFR